MCIASTENAAWGLDTRLTGDGDGDAGYATHYCATSSSYLVQVGHAVKSGGIVAFPFRGVGVGELSAHEPSELLGR